MAIKQSKLDQIPQRNKDLAFGFVKRNEKANTCTIPAMIKYLCLVYLNQNKDAFVAKNTDENIKIDGNKLTLMKLTKYGVKSTYLRNVVNTGVHIWHFECGSDCIHGFGDMIGIISNNASLQLNNNYFHTVEKDATAYGFALTGTLAHGQTRKQYGDRCKKNDIVQMRVDFNDLTLSYKINENDYGKAFYIKQGQYTAAISMFEWGDKEPRFGYTLISYQHIY